MTLPSGFDSIYNAKERYQGHYTKCSYLRIYKKVAEYIKPTDYVLELGCGTGQMMELLLDNKIKKYTGYDFSPVGIQMTQNRIKDYDATAICQDLYEIEKFPDADIYISIEVMEHLKDELSVLKSIPKGKKVIITVPNYLGSGHVRKFDKPIEVLARYSNIIDCIDIITVPYGSGKIFLLYGVIY